MILILFLLLLLLLLLFQFERNSLFYHDKEKDICNKYIFFNNELTLSGHLNLFSRGGCHLDNPHILACN